MLQGAVVEAGPDPALDPPGRVPAPDGRRRGRGFGRGRGRGRARGKRINIGIVSVVACVAIVVATSARMATMIAGAIAMIWMR